MKSFSSASNTTIIRSPLLAHAMQEPRREASSLSARLSIRPHAILDIVRRRGRSWGLSAQYEESRLRFNHLAG